MRTIDSVKGLVKEESNGPTCIYPTRTILVQAWIVPEECKKVDNDESESRKGDLYVLVRKADCEMVLPIVPDSG